MFSRHLCRHAPSSSTFTLPALRTSDAVQERSWRPDTWHHRRLPGGQEVQGRLDGLVQVDEAGVEAGVRNLLLDVPRVPEPMGGLYSLVSRAIFHKADSHHHLLDLQVAVSLPEVFVDAVSRGEHPPVSKKVVFKLKLSELLFEIIYLEQKYTVMSYKAYRF